MTETICNLSLALGEYKTPAYRIGLLEYLNYFSESDKREIIGQLRQEFLQDFEPFQVVDLSIVQSN